jgi:hypothetical protein
MIPAWQQTCESDFHRRRVRIGRVVSTRLALARSRCARNNRQARLSGSDALKLLNERSLKSMLAKDAKAKLKREGLD